MASLLIHAIWDKAVTFPVDSHVWHAFRSWSWTNAKMPDECSWQAYCWMPPEYFITTNDAVDNVLPTINPKKFCYTKPNSCMYILLSKHYRRNLNHTTNKYSFKSNCHLHSSPFQLLNTHIVDCCFNCFHCIVIS
jgi:hypothetical protein